MAGVACLHRLKKSPVLPNMEVVSSKPVVLLTGCSNGLGLETAVALAQKNWRVYATMRNLSRFSLGVSYLIFKGGSC